jgi:hypothetical protein
MTNNYWPNVAPEILVFWTKEKSPRTMMTALTINEDIAKTKE